MILRCPQHTGYTVFLITIAFNGDCFYILCLHRTCHCLNNIILSPGSSGIIEITLTISDDILSMEPLNNSAVLTSTGMKIYILISTYIVTPVKQQYKSTAGSVSKDDTTFLPLPYNPSIVLPPGRMPA